jgi:hypothetical protein
MVDYFVDQPLYNDDHFRRRFILCTFQLDVLLCPLQSMSHHAMCLIVSCRFRMRQELFLKIVRKIEAANPYFVQQPNCVGQLRFTLIHKCMVAMNMLAYGGATDSLDDHLKVGESTVLETLKTFVNTIIQVFGEEWLRLATNEEVQHILAVNAARGFSGMLGSIDCMYWEWSSCPTAYHGMYRRHMGKPTIILEAVATCDLRIWHAFFGMPDSHNDINMLQRSPVFDDLANGRAPPVEFNVNGTDYHMGYYLADGIYPDWATLVNTIPSPISNKDKYFTERQESVCKDVEQSFGTLQRRFKILHNPTHLWKQKDLNSIMKACIILHNMIIEDKNMVIFHQFTTRSGQELLIHQSVTLLI